MLTLQEKFLEQNTKKQINNLFNPKQITKQGHAVTFKCNYCFVIHPLQNPTDMKQHGGNECIAQSTNVHRFCGKQKVTANLFSSYMIYE